MTKLFDYDMSAENTEVAVFDAAEPAADFYIARPRIPLDGVTPYTAGTWASFNAGVSPPVTDVEVSLSGGEMLMQLKNDWEPWGLGRLQLDEQQPPVGTRALYERSSLRLPSSMNPYTSYGPTWYGFKEYRIGFNWIRENDTQFQINITNPSGTDYLLFSPTMNHYIFTNPAPDTTGSFQNAWFDTPGVKVPIDETFETMSYIRAGFTDGRWLFRVKFTGEKWQTLWDYQGNTFHPDETEGVDIKLLNPLKVYTNSTLINYMNDNAGECALACSRLQAWAGQ